MLNTSLHTASYKTEDSKCIVVTGRQVNAGFQLYVSFDNHRILRLVHKDRREGCDYNLIVGGICKQICASKITVYK